jgi:hypothetical protein
MAGRLLQRSRSAVQRAVLGAAILNRPDLLVGLSLHIAWSCSTATSLKMNFAMVAIDQKANATHLSGLAP